MFFLLQRIRANKMGFTLFELMLSVGVIAVLGGAVYISVRPDQLLAQARDSQRIADTNELATLIAKKKTQDVRIRSLGATSTLYLSLPAQNSDCSDIADLFSPPIGFSYHCVTEANLRNTDGTGWIPIDFTADRFSVLPIDPVNDAALGSYYVYVYDGTNFEIDAPIESDKLRSEVSSKDSGSLDTVYETGSSVLVVNDLYSTGFAEGSACTQNSDCANNSCITLYADSDGDGYGAGDPLGDFCYVAAADVNTRFAHVPRQETKQSLSIELIPRAYAAIPAGKSTNNTDCNDSNASLYQNISGYSDADSDTYTTGVSQQVCSGTSLPSGYRASANGNDCNDADVSKWQNLTGYTDSDGDGYGAGSSQQVCSGNTLASGYVSSIASVDCDNSNASIYPGTTRARYSSVSVACGTASDSETQTCQSSGSWTGTYALTTPPAASTRTAYATLTSACGTYSYSSESQTCQLSGSWSGTYTLTSAPSATTRTRYAALTSACGTYSSTSETQTCLSSGSFSGTYTLTSAPSATNRVRYATLTSACGTYGSTSETQYCQSSGSFSGTYTLTSAPSADTRTRYAALTSACGTYDSTSETQSCLSSGSWTGTYILTSAPSATTRTRYAAATSACGTYGSLSETQTCLSSGLFNGTYTLTSAPSADTRTRYADLTSACGTYGSASETQTCRYDGSWSGTYTLTAASSATTRTAYQASSVCGGSCTSESQTCLSSGSWSGTYAYTSCSVQTPTTYYRDADGDGYGISSQTTSACTQPSGYVVNSTDCYDLNASARPGQTSFLYSHRGDGSFDYNCDSVETKGGTGSYYYCTATPSYLPYTVPGKNGSAACTTYSTAYQYCPYASTSASTFNAGNYVCGGLYPGAIVLTSFIYYNAGGTCSGTPFGYYSLNNTAWKQQSCR